MSKADKMFEKIGWIRSLNNNEIIRYYYKYDTYTAIKFLLDKGIIQFSCLNCLTMQELQAINEKAKELGWL